MKTFREIISDFRSRALDIDCFDMSLTQKVPENPILFKGKGYIRQTADDKLKCKLYAEKTVNTDLWKWTGRALSSRSGQLYSDSDYSNLTARDADAVVWTVELVLPNCNWRSDEDNPIVTGDLTTLTMEGPAASREHSVYLHFFEDVELPLMIDKFKFFRDNYTFAVEKLEGSFTIEVSSNTALPDGFAGRVQEALRFMLAQSISWRALCVSDGKRQSFHVASEVQRSRNTRLYPPIGRGKSHAYINDCWNMFFLYLQYILKNSQPGYWSYCSYHLDNACEASANSADAWSYGLCIAVEGLSALLPSKKDDGTIARLKDMTKDIISFVGKMDCYSMLAKRLKGTLDGMANEPPPDRMYLLIPTGHLDAKHVEAWKKLRNKYVHPKKIGLKELNEKKLQELIDTIHKVTVLMYHIVFYIIDYNGHFTDYSALGFPEKTYPSTAAEAT